MDSLLVQLENNEAVLLMYLADELPPEDKAEVDALLAMDANLRRSLDQIRRANAYVDATLARLDTLDPLPLTESAATRIVLRSLRQWQLTRHGRVVAEPVRQTAKMPRWVYATATAACVGLALLVGWGLRPDNNNFLKTQYVKGPGQSSQDNTLGGPVMGGDRPDMPPLFALADPVSENVRQLTDIKQQMDQLDEVALRSASGDRDSDTVDAAVLSNAGVSR